MKIRLERDVMAEAVTWAARSLPSRPPAPILTGLLIQATQDEVTLSSFDFDTSAKIAVKGVITEPGEVLVSGKLLADIARQLPARPVDLTSDNHHLELVCGSARFTLQTLPLNEYPTLPEMPAATGSVESAEFAKAVGQVVVAAGRDELLPVFTGVRVELDGQTLSLLATDRYRMALKELNWNPESATAQGAALVPAKVLADTAKSMTSGEKVTMNIANAGVGDGLIGFEGIGAGGVRHTTTTLLDGEFPKVRHLMNVQAAVSVRCATQDVIASVKRVALVAERNTPLRMIIGDGSIALEAATGDQAQASEAIEATVENHTGGEPAITAAGFNPHYLSDALAVLETPYVHFAFTAPGKPCLITGLESLDGEQLLDYRHVIMLMRLPDLAPRG